MRNSLSIITPHKNDFKGLQSLFQNLQNQITTQWEWIIVDDNSDEIFRESVVSFFSINASPNIKVLFNNESTNASLCRNLGFDNSKYKNVVFLDSDDTIANDFVANRLIDVTDFTVFLNFNIINTTQSFPFSTIKSDFLDHYLKAKFAWQTTAILWDRDFLKSIGKFDIHLKLLQDVEVSIRALILSKNYSVLYDNKVDFYYYVKPVDVKKRSVEKVATSVDYLVNLIFDTYNLSPQKTCFLINYYYMLARYLVRSEEIEKFNYAFTTLKNLYNKKVVSWFFYLIGLGLLRAYKNNIITGALFLKLNRRIFKKE